MTNKNHGRILNSFYAKLGALIHKYSLISDGDKILIGVSGGIDSMSLLSGLATRREHSKAQYTLTACYIDVENLEYEIDTEWLKHYCEGLNVNLIIENINVDFSDYEDRGKCYACSRDKRRALFDIANSGSFNKIALGHHMDDAIETLLLNMFCHSQISSLPASLSMFNGKVSLIRPLIEFSKHEITEISESLQIKKLKTDCPYEYKTFRRKAADIIEYIEDEFGYSRKNIFDSMGNIKFDYLTDNSLQRE